MRRFLFCAGLGVASGATSACFTAPAADVMFSCDPASSPQCPASYTCEADGCCHRDGSDVAAHLGECKLQGGTDGATTMLPATTTGTGTTSAGTDTTTSGPTTTATDGPATTSSATGDSSATGESSSATTTTMG